MRWWGGVENNLHTKCPCNHACLELCALVCMCLLARVLVHRRQATSMARHCTRHQQTACLLLARPLAGVAKHPSQQQWLASWKCHPACLESCPLKSGCSHLPVCVHVYICACTLAVLLVCLHTCSPSEHVPTPMTRGSDPMCSPVGSLIRLSAASVGGGLLRQLLSVCSVVFCWRGL